MLLRCPEGRTKTCFFQKHPSTQGLPALRRVEIEESKGRTTYLAVQDVTGLVSLAQIYALEIHVWGATADAIEKPDRMVFDIDPDPKTPWPEVVETARRLRAELEAYDLESFLKTTGGKGLHLVVPLRRGPGWEAIKQFSLAIGMALAREAPDRYTLHLVKARRNGRIFIDTLRNGRGATWIAPFSTRARPGAPVSAPIAWDELTDRLRPDAFDVRHMRARISRADPWRGMEGLRQTVTATMLRSTQARRTR
jgi:bifunctional non-homologous end joining protein LigD